MSDPPDEEPPEPELLPWVAPPRGTGRIVGVDHGSVRVGLALCDSDRRLASPLETYTRRTPELDAAYFLRLAREQNVSAFVIGLPVYLSGDESPQSAICRRFGAWLGELTGLPVAYWDERFTSAAADDFLWDAGLSPKKRKDRRDRVAATLILGSYLDAGCPAGG